MEAVPRMPMIWLDLKEAGEFEFSPSVRQFILKNYGENPDSYNEQLKKLETLRQGAVNVTRDFEGCSILRKYFGQLHYLQSRVPLGPGQEAAVPISWTEIFSGKTVTHDDISYEQACILYNLGELNYLNGVGKTMDHFSHNFSVDMSHQILNLNINLMLGQAQECLLEKSMLDNRKSFLVARISAQVVDYYKEACRALENSDTASMLGKIQKDWKKLVQMKISYFASIAHLHMGKQAEEQQKYGERLAYLQSSLDKLSEAIKLAKGQPDSVQEALKFTMDVIGGKFNSAKKDNDFIYHETVPSLETLASVKGAPLVKALPVNPTDPSVTGPDLFAKLVPMAAHEASSLYSEEKAKLLRDIMAKIDSRNETLEQFMDSLGLEPDSVDNLDMYSHIPPVLMEKCAALSVRPDTVKSLIQSMQVLSGVFTDVEASLREIRDVLEEDEAGVRALQEAAGGGPAAELHPQAHAQTLAEIRRDLEKYMEAHEKASFTNTELHRAMNLHISNLRLLGGPLDALRDALPRPQLNQEEVAGLQCMKRILGKVQEMRDQRSTLEKQLRDLIQQDDITSSLVTTERTDMKRLFEEQLKKYEQVKVYIDQNLSAQENILKALTEANVQYSSVRKGLAETEHKWNGTVQTLVASYEAYEDLMKKSQEGKEFYEDLETKSSRLLERAKTLCQAREEERKAVLDRETQKNPPSRPTAAKPSLGSKGGSDVDSACSSLEDAELAQINAAILSLGGDLPDELHSLPPDHPSLHSAIRPLYTSQFPPNHRPPQFPGPLPAQRFPRGPFTQLPPQQTPVSGYTPPQPQAPQTGGVGPARAPFLPSTTTVDSIQTPIPSYNSAPRHPVPPTVSAGYAVPPQMGVYPQYMTQPGVPMQAPSQVPHQHPQHQYQHPPGQLPPGYQSAPRAMPGPRPPPQAQQGYPQYIPPQHQPRPPMPPQYQQPYPGQPQPQPQHGYQPQLPQGYQPQHPQQGYLPQQPPHMIPRGPHPQMPTTSQPMPPVSQPYMQPANQQMPLHPHQQMLPPQQQHMHPNAQQMHPHPQIQPMPPGLHQPMPPASQPQHVHLPQPPIMPQSAPQQSQAPQPVAPMTPTMYPTPPGVNGSPGAPPQPTSMGQPRPPPQHMIPPTAGAPPVALPPNVILPSPSPSPSPSPGPSSLGLAPQRPSPAPTPGGPPSLPSSLSPSTSLFPHQNSITDDLLSSSPESQPGGPKAPANVLQPTKADPQDGERRKKSSQGVRLIQGDPYQAPERVARLCGELERFRSAVESLERPSVDEGGLSPLDARWKELQEGQERDARQLSIAIARCYTMKNRHQDVMPYDCNRVLLRSGKDDYINGSFVEELSPYCPRLIATQAPLSGTAADFWLMVWEQKVSLVVMLVSEQELDKGKVLCYFPTERGQQLAQGPITVTLTTQKTTPTHVERMIGLQYRDQSLKRTVIHLQFTSWPELGLPESKSNLICFIQEVHGYYLHQRPLHTPIVVHCSSGVGRTGALCLLYAAVQELEAGNSIPDLPLLVQKMRQQRKNMLQEKLHLKFCYEAVLKHAEQVLQRHGYLPTAPCSKTPSTAPYSRQESQQDIVLGGDMTISSIQATIAKLSIRPPSATDPAMDPVPDIGAPSGLEDQPFTPPTGLPLDRELEPAATLARDPFPSGTQPSSLSPTLSSPEEVQSPPPNGVDTSSPNNQVTPDPAPPSGPALNSLELLASLTAEAFSMEGGGCKGKHRVTKQSFLQPAEGQGLHQGPREEEGDDPLSNLDPLWSLNKN
uniref:Tyrosine-protein phosphatase non-receptor type 23 n=1 Tax=Oncorhynchus kisutch TaxID=8019 RepID=A0A8C7H2W9_ONCKI